MKRCSHSGRNRVSKKWLAAAILSIPAKRISFTRRSCRVPNSRSMRPLACGLWAAIHSIQFLQSSSELRERFFSAQLLLECSHAAAMAKNTVLIGVMGQRTSMALQPASQRSQVFFAGIVLDQARPQPAGGIIDHRDQLTGWTPFLQPTKRGAILHHQLSKTGPPLAPHMDDLHALGARTPQMGPGHPSPQGLAAHRQSLLG